jgi:uncharacterized membrane protein
LDSVCAVLASVSFYSIVVFVHVSAAVIAFGVTFVYPVLGPFVRRTEPRMLPTLHRARDRIGRLVITPGATVLLVAGVYLAARGPYDFSTSWVSAGIVIVVVLLGLGGTFFSPHERRAAELAERDLAASTGSAAITLSAEYEAVARRLEIVGAAGSLLVLVAIFLMVVKPGS